MSNEVEKDYDALLREYMDLLGPKDIVEKIIADGLKMSVGIEKGYNVALHGIRASKGSKEIAESIMNTGLNMYGRQSIRTTTIQLGDEYRNSKFKEQIEKYLKGYIYGASSEGYRVVVITPTVIQNSEGERLFLGDPYTGNRNEDFASGGQEWESTCILDIACANLKRIPAEFIYGYIEPDTNELIENPNYYLRHRNDMEKQDSLFELIKCSLNGIDVKISQDIANADWKTLESIKPALKRYSMGTHLEIIRKAEKYYKPDLGHEIEEI